MKTQNFRDSWRNVITYCIYCKSTILWDSYGTASILKYGNSQVFDCMQHGCGLIIEKVTADHSTPQELASLLLILIEGGIPSDVAESAVLKLVENRIAA